LIVNELITNALKYAFPDLRRGEIRIILHKIDNDLIELTVSDNGIGVPEGFEFETSGKTGIKSIYNIALHQLQGGMIKSLCEDKFALGDFRSKRI
jgi:two-component sensor histidine kinase